MTDGNHSTAWYSKYVMNTERFELIRPMGGNLDESWNLQESGKIYLWNAEYWALESGIQLWE